MGVPLDRVGEVAMKKNDPDFLVSKAVKEFISQQDENTRVAIVIFDQGVRLPVALTTSSLANRETILNSIEAINYQGLFTDSPAGIERAIYELKNNGRDSAQKSIIFMIKYLATLVTESELYEHGITVKGPVPQRVPIITYPKFTPECDSLLKKHLTIFNRVKSFWINLINFF
mgnify:CR=1 FL=1